MTPVDQGRLLADAIEQFKRWRATRSPADLESAIALFTELDTVVADEPGLRYFADLLHATALADRYQLSDSIADIDGVIERLKRVVAEPDPPPGVGQDDIDASHVALGRALANRIGMYGRPGGPPLAADAEFLEELQTAVDELAVGATTSSQLATPVERAETAALRAYLVPKLVLTRDIIGRKAGRLADIPELERVLRELPADHPNRPHLLLELGFAHMHLMLRPGPARPSFSTSKHRLPAVKYLSMGVELLEPAYPERAKAIAFLSYLSLTRRPHSPDAATGPARELTAQALEVPGLDPNVGAVLRLLASMTAGPGSVPGDLAAAASHLSQALGLARKLGQADDPPKFMKALPAAVVGAFRGLLSTAQVSSPSLDDQDAADARGRELLRHLSESGLLEEMAAEMPGLSWVTQLTAPPVRRGQAASERLNTRFLEGDLEGVDSALAELREQLAELAADDEFRWLLLAQVGAGWRIRGTLSGLLEDSVRGLETLVDAMDQAAVCSPVTQLVDGAEWTARLRAASALAELGRLRRDPRDLTAAMERMSRLRRVPDLTPGGRTDLSTAHGMALLWRHDLTRDPRDLTRAITKLRDASGTAGEDVGYGLLRGLSVAYWTRGRRARRDQERAITAGLRALRQRAAGVLLQSGAPQGLRAARAHGSEGVIRLAGWCLAEGRPDQAIEALERGRALVLHVATVTTDLGGLLRLAGHDSLADEWRAEAVSTSARASGPFTLLEPGLPDQPADLGAGQSLLRVPSLLRRRVLSALHDTSAGGQLLAVPGLADLGVALRLAGADAFVYLISPPGEDGCALVVTADGGTGHVPLPGLSCAAPLDAYDAAFHAAARDEWAGGARGAWHQALGALCTWAWDAATAPVRQWLATHQAGQQDKPGRIPRIVLIPVGRLGVVPWHAALTTGADGRPHYAVEDAVFSYAASAGQFIRAARRQARPWDAAPLLLSDPTDELVMARLEVTELRRRYYPGAVFLGLPAELASGRGTPDEILSRLPGGSEPPASLMHCGCHANVAPSLAASHLLLAEGRPLPIADILAQAERRDPASPGFLAVLSACLTDLAQVDHDEALTLASALLAAGASAVIGARWPADDRCTAPLMVMLHHFLNNGHPRPADALRAAQLWMLDKDRASLTGLPPELANAFDRGRSFDAPHAWAAFACHGA